MTNRELEERIQRLKMEEYRKRKGKRGDATERHGGKVCRGESEGAERLGALLR